MSYCQMVFTVLSSGSHGSAVRTECTQHCRAEWVVLVTVAFVPFMPQSLRQICVIVHQSQRMCWLYAIFTGVIKHFLMKLKLELGWILLADTQTIEDLCLQKWSNLIVTALSFYNYVCPNRLAESALGMSSGACLTSCFPFPGQELLQDKCLNVLPWW